MRMSGAIKEAAELYVKAAQLRPDSLAANTNAGIALRLSGRPDRALPFLEAACRLEPSRLAVRRLLGIAYSECDRHAEAVVCIRDALRGNPRDAEAWYLLGMFSRDRGRFTEAEQCYRRAISFAPRHSQALTNLAEVLQIRGHSAEAVALYRNVARMQPECDLVSSNMLLAMHYCAGTTAEQLAREHRAWGQAFSAEQRLPRVERLPVEGDARLRIGYVSPDFRCHSVAWFFSPVLDCHDRRRFSVYCYANVKNPDATTRRLRARADHWRDISGLSDEQALKRIEDDRIDILIDLAGHTAGNRLRLFALRAAPRQVTWLGYPNTSGLRAMDVRLTDAVADPAGADTWYTEKLVRLPNGFVCYAPPPDAPGVAKKDSSEGVIFGSFNNTAKINDAVIEAWAAILRAVPGSRLLLKASLFDDTGGAENFRNRFTRHGVCADRLMLIGRQAATAGHLSRYNQVHIALDTYPYNGTTTTCEALWMGTPVVTLYGDIHAARVSASLLHRIGAPELIANTPQDYIERATALACDTQRQCAYWQSLRTRMRHSSLCDAAGFVQELERALEMIAASRFDKR